MKTGLRRFDMMRRVAAGVMAFALYGASDTIIPSAQPPDADTIFSLARDAASTQRCPARLEYVIVVAADIDGRVEQNHFRATYLYDLDYLHVDAFSREEQQHPFVTHGVNVLVTLPFVPLIGLSRALTAKVNHDGAPLDLLGIPVLKPSYTFGLRRSSQESPQPQDTRSPSGLRVIGSTTARLRDYAVELVGVEKYEGHEAYHLRLTPLREPSHYRLREVWVDASSYAVLQIITDGNFIDGPPTRSEWVTTYQDVDGCRVIDREVALGLLDYGRGRKYEKTTIFFDLIKDPAAYRVPIVTFRRPQGDDDLLEPDE